MTAATPTYRWNTLAAAEAYDQAAPVIHPYYVTVQDQILDHLPFAADERFEIVDIGGGSGRMAERLLKRFAGARVTVVDQSEPFLALAERRLAPFAPRATFIQCRLQDDWAADLRAAPKTIISTSAIHHLEPAEKQALYARCYQALTAGGMFVNGDEYRPADDAEYLALLQEWSAHMSAAIAGGRIPEAFRAALDQWHERNIKRFGEPKTSGDDCLETIKVQLGYLGEAGFAAVETAWGEKLWAVLVSRK